MCVKTFHQISVSSLSEVYRITPVVLPRATGRIIGRSGFTADGGLLLVQATVHPTLFFDIYNVS